MCYLSAAVSLFITLRVSTVGACVAGLSATALFLYGGFGPYASIVLDLAPRNMRGAFAGFINTGGQIGGFVAPIAVGYIARDTGSFTGRITLYGGRASRRGVVLSDAYSYVSRGEAQDGRAVAALPRPSHM
jgi:nitrate/nitrite transporter NarK